MYDHRSDACGVSASNARVATGATKWTVGGPIAVRHCAVMSKPEERDVPNDRLITPFRDAVAHHTDAYSILVSENVELSTYIAAFYTTWLFRLERVVLRVFARAPSSDAEAVSLGQGTTDRFAVWRVEGQSEFEILLGERSGRTKSWLAVEPLGDGTRLWFGSIVTPIERKGKLTLGPVFDSLLGAHKVYSRLLLMAAAQRVGAIAQPGHTTPKS